MVEIRFAAGRSPCAARHFPTITNALASAGFPREADRGAMQQMIREEDPGLAEAQLYRRLEAIGVAYMSHAHAPVFTVEEARALRGALPGQHCKCLLLIGRKGELFLVVVREEIAVDLKWLAHELGAGRFSFAKAELLWETLRVKPGAVTPFALMNDPDHRVRPVLDAEMLEAVLVNYHPLRNDRTTAVAPDGLLRFIADCGHEARILRFPP
jgi:Ala-tRNA(Pro) deacylase